MTVGIIPGDPNGIGPEIAVKAARAVRAEGIETLLIGDPAVFARYGADTPVHALTALAPEAFAPGTVDARAGAATVEYVKAAVALARTGVVSAIAAGPHSESAINRAGIAFSGYGGLLADLTDTPRKRVFLMLVAAALRIAHVTLHASVREALAALSAERIAAAGRAAIAATRALGVSAPRLGVFGINPHAGEGGLFGSEDDLLSAPAVATLRAEGHAVDGPTGGDVLLAARGHDVYLAMFHDQGHIPIKLASPYGASAFTIGVPIAFASVAHGAAFDRAGRGIADAAALTATVRLLANARGTGRIG